jgi:hypothetical protein
MTQLIDANTLCSEMAQRGEIWADADAAFRALDDASKSVLSKCMGQVQAKSNAEKERVARCDPTYLAHLDTVQSARAAANKARVRYDTYRVFVELTRSNASTERALAQMH